MRDFFYNKGDVLIAILIILVAATVIYFRVGIVMGNPDPGERIRGFFSSLNLPGQSGEPAVTGTEGDEEKEAAPPVNTAPPTQEDPAQENPTQTDEPSGQDAEPEDQAPPPSADVTITVNAGDAASIIADKLLAAGAISDKQAFLAEVEAQGAASKLKQGTFTIPAGSSINDIIKILVG